VFVRHAGRGHQVEHRHQSLRNEPDLLLAFAQRRLGRLLTRLDVPGRHLDQIAPAERKLRAQPELADQDDLVARKIDGKNHRHAPDPHHLAGQWLVLAGKADAIAFIVVAAPPDQLPSRECRIGRTVGQIGLIHVSGCLIRAWSLRDEALGRGFQIERGGEQCARVGVFRRLEHLGRRPGFDDLALAHHHQAARQRRHHA
jgi:hypothetical protein